MVNFVTWSIQKFVLRECKKDKNACPNELYEAINSVRS